MRTRGSFTGPLVVIAIGALFLMHAVSPSFPIGDLLLHYWPYLLIFWGVVQLAEVTIRTLAGGAIPVNGISGGAWLLIVLICLVGLTAFEVHKPGAWWRSVSWQRSVEAFGEEHDYGIQTMHREVGKTPKIVLESFRGDVKIAGNDGSELTVGGHKVIRAFDVHDSDRANSQTPVDIVTDGANIVIRCNQDKSGTRTPVSTDLEITLPKGASVQATGQGGDFDITSLSGDVDISSDNADVRVENISGNIKVDTRHSDLIRCTNVEGGVDLRGHGSDVELMKVAGQVTLNGDFTGTVSMRELAKPVRIENIHTELDAQEVPGEIRLDRGSLNVQNVVGPLRLTTRATDVTIDGFSNGLEVSVDKGDIDLRPGRIPLGKMVVHTRSGDIELALPQAASFALNASTDHGDVENEFGDVLKQRIDGRSARLEGSVGSGPDLNLTTDRGSITVKKASGETQAKQAGVM